MNKLSANLLLDAGFYVVEVRRRRQNKELGDWEVVAAVIDGPHTGPIVNSYKGMCQVRVQKPQSCSRLHDEASHSQTKHTMEEATQHPVTTEDFFVKYFNEIADDVHSTALEKGWWDKKRQLLLAASEYSDELWEYAKLVLAGNGIALITSEASEWLEGLRHGNPPDDKIPEFSSEASEAADIIIRIMDEARGRNIPVAEALVAKIKMNKTRQSMHGKKF